MKKDIALIFAVIIISFLTSSCRFVTYSEDVEESKTTVKTTVEHADWTESAVIYEVNIRQYTPEGTFRAFLERIPKLKELDVDILWLMPIYPIGGKNRKGSLGSYYSVKDYMAVNPEFGTSDDFEDLVKEIHGIDKYVIIDWVANHTSWDNKLIKEHPEWYKKDSLGKIISPYDWTDVAQLDYSNRELRNYMTEAMKYWVEEYDIDGFRCDVAGLVPCDFWDSTRKVLEELKPVFMLAEAEDETCLVENAFDMNYAWELHHIMNNIMKGTMDARHLRKYFKQQDSIYDPAVYRMNFITNHDENSWNGTEFERLGEATELFAFFSFVAPGMPLIYSGQEVGSDKRLRFFDKDTINWTDNNQWFQFYSKLIEMKREHPVLWNGEFGGALKTISSKDSKKVFAFKRTSDTEQAFVLMNLTNQPVMYKIKGEKLDEFEYSDFFTDEIINIEDSISLAPYGYRLFIEEL